MSHTLYASNSEAAPTSAPLNTNVEYSKGSNGAALEHHDATKTSSDDGSRSSETSGDVDLAADESIRGQPNVLRFKPCPMLEKLEHHRKECTEWALEQIRADYPEEED
jgi:hypothetical protein